MPVIELENVEFSYTAGVPVLSVPSLTIEAGEKIFIYGPSGSGKTTLLGLLAGVVPLQKGEIRVLGQSLRELRPAARDRFRGDHFGYIFQMFNLIPYLSVRDNILLSLELSAKRRERLGSRSKAEAVLEVAEHLGIASLLDRRVTKLSMGQQQRVAAARALLGAPEIIIADEPTSALDSDHREKFLQLLFSQCGHSTVIFVSHDRSLEPLFDRSVSLPEINRL